MVLLEKLGRWQSELLGVQRARRLSDPTGWVWEASQGKGLVERPLGKISALPLGDTISLVIFISIFFFFCISFFIGRIDR